MRSDERLAKAISVIHVGNDPDDTGGIASVIGRHVSRELEGISASALASYAPSGTSFYTRNIPAVRAAAKLFQIKNAERYILHFHLSQRGSLVREGALLLYASTRKFHAVVATIHGSSTLDAGRFHRSVLRQILNRADISHVLSSQHKRKLGKLKSRIAIIPNDIQLPATVRKLSDRPRVVLFVGAVGHRKGVDLLLDAWEKIDHQDWTLTLAGPRDGTDSNVDAILSRIAADTSVNWLGNVPRTEISSLYQLATIYVLPSRAEAYPVALCEATAHGCAVVASDVAGAREILGDDYKAIVKQGSSSELESTLRRLMGTPRLCEELGVSNRSRASDLFDPARSATNWSDLYRSTGHKGWVG